MAIFRKDDDSTPMTDEIGLNTPLDLSKLEDVIASSKKSATPPENTAKKSGSAEKKTDAAKETEREAEEAPGIGDTGKAVKASPLEEILKLSEELPQTAVDPAGVLGKSAEKAEEKQVPVPPKQDKNAAAEPVKQVGKKAGKAKASGGKPVESLVEKSVERSAGKPVEKSVEKPVEKSAGKKAKAPAAEAVKTEKPKKEKPVKAPENTEAKAENPAISPKEKPVKQANEKPVKETKEKPSKAKKSTDRLLSVYTDILVALLPIVAWAVYIFGLRVLTVVLISAAVSALSEYLIGLLLRQSPDILDPAPAVEGIVLALFLPVTVPLWVPAVAALVSGVFVRRLIRPYGSCRLDPTAASVCAVTVLFPAAVGSVCDAFCRLPALSLSPEFEKLGTLSLDVLGEGLLPVDSLGACLFGLRSGMIGELSTVLLILAAVYLVIRKVLRPAFPAAFVLTLGVLCYLFPRVVIESDVIAMQFTAYNLMIGNLLPAVIFTAAVPGTVPLTKNGAIAAGVIGGAVTYAVRYFLPVVPADALVGILVVSLLSKPLDRIFLPTGFGRKK